MTKAEKAIYISNKPKILTFVITRNPLSAESKIRKRIDKNKESFLGSGFGRFDLLFEVESETAGEGFEILNEIRKDFLKNPKSRFFAGSLLSLLCYPIRLNARKRKNQNTVFPYRAYSVFRVIGDGAAEVLEAFGSMKINEVDNRAEMLWNPSLMSFVLRLQGKNIDVLTESLARMRMRALPIRDYCTFMVLSEPLKTDGTSRGTISASINVKLGDSRLLPLMLKYPSTEYRLGYFDITRDITRKSPEALLRTIRQMRKPFKTSGPPNWTGTVLKFDPSKILGEGS